MVWNSLVTFRKLFAQQLEIEVFHKKSVVLLFRVYVARYIRKIHSMYYFILKQPHYSLIVFGKLVVIYERMHYRFHFHSRKQLAKNADKLVIFDSGFCQVINEVVIYCC